MPYNGPCAFDVALLVLMQPIQFVYYFFTDPYTMSMTSTIFEVTMEIIVTVVLSGVTLLLAAARLIDEAILARKHAEGTGDFTRKSGEVDCTGCED